MAVPFLPLPQKLTPQAAADYLEGCVPPHRLPTWEPILAHLRAASPARPESGRPLAEVVATPLGLWLLRTVYIERNSDPAPLLHRERFPTPGALRDHLFDRLIDALIDARPPLDGPEKNADRFRPRRHRDPRQVRAWLGYLARLLSDQDTRDLAWWRLPTAVPAPASLFKYVTGFMGGLAAGLVGGLASGLMSGSAEGLTLGLIGGLALGLLVKSTAESVAADLPGHADLRLRHRWKELLRKLAGGLGTGLRAGIALGITSGLAGGIVGRLTDGLAEGVAVGLSVGLAGGLAGGIGLGVRIGLAFGIAGAFMSPLIVIFTSTSTDGLADELMFGLTAGVTGGLAFGLTSGLIEWAETPTSTNHAITPMESWNSDRALHLIRIGTTMLVEGLVLGIALELVFTEWLALGFALGLVLGLASGLTFGGHRAWSMYLVASWWWTWKNLLPRRLMPFLDDCHRLGLLRAIGPIYQFRHAEFQDYLAADHRRAHGTTGGSRAGEETASENAGR